MKVLNKSFITVFMALFGLSTLAMQSDTIDATQWTIDKAHSNIEFSVSHFFTQVEGNFTDYEASVYFSPDNLSESSIEVTIPVESINTGNNRRDGHLQSPDFFNAEKHPTITFVSDNIESTGNNEFVANGTLTIKDISKQIELPFTLLGVKDNPFKEGTLVAGISASTEINRTDFEVGTGDWASDAVVGDNVKINLNLELNAEK